MTQPAVTATFIATQGEYLEAVIEVAGQRLHVMDEFGGSQLAAGAQFQAQLWPMASEVDRGIHWAAWIASRAMTSTLAS